MERNKNLLEQIECTQELASQWKEEFCLTSLVLGSRSTLLHSQPPVNKIVRRPRVTIRAASLLLWQRDAEGGPEAT